ncbi:MAG TPA: spermidine synthase [Acidimicrobiia bacterium]|nr:spermidine synthase [Acidimicrobiia bacterium]
MSARFEEIDRRQTPMGEITVRRRLEPTLLIDVYEVKLDDEFLMSSLFTVAEIELAKLALAELPGTDIDVDVVVGGLGLGYTARAVLEDPRVRSVRVVEALSEVIEWHQQDLLPLATVLTSDPRCHLINGDFFAMVGGGSSFGPHAPDRCHAILVDIDHTPRHLLHPSHAPFYEPEGLARLAGRLHPGGVFGLWSDDPPDRDSIAVVKEVFASCEAHVITFANFYTGGESASTVYVAKVDDA